MTNRGRKQLLELLYGKATDLVSSNCQDTYCENYGLTDIEWSDGMTFYSNEDSAMRWMYRHNNDYHIYACALDGSNKSSRDVIDYLDEHLIALARERVAKIQQILEEEKQ